MRPEDFDGNTAKASQWMSDYHYCAIVNDWSNKKMAERMPAYLTKSARNWYKVSVMGSKIEKDFRKIEEQFNLVFNPHSNKSTEWT